MPDPAPRPPRPAPRRRGVRRAGPAAVLLAVAAAAGLGVHLALRSEDEARARREGAMATALRELARAQSAALEARAVDLDGDGVGEALTFQELTGLAGVRTSPDGRTRGPALSPPPLAAGPRELWGNGLVHAPGAHGYILAVHLPATGGGSAREGLAGAGFEGTVATDPAERRWCAYLWSRGEPGDAYFVDADGTVLASDNADRHYLAADLVPRWDAARARGAPGGWDAPAAVDAVGNDGREWRRVP